jgi:hypothetical protein
MVDSFGAGLTAFFLFVVLKNFNAYVGMPPTILTYLSIIAASFCIYSIGCFLFLKDYWVSFIRAISIANLLYCILTLGLVIVHYPALTTIGTAYFLVEIVIICTLVYIELNVANTIRGKRNS